VRDETASVASEVGCAQRDLEATALPTARVHPARRRLLVDQEELALSLVIALVSAIRVGIAVAADEDFGAGATIALGLLVLGLLGILRATRLPRFGKGSLRARRATETTDAAPRGLLDEAGDP
jgi:hypothetical protein